MKEIKAFVKFMLGAEAPFEVFPTICDAHGMNLRTMKKETVGDICVFISPFIILHCPVTSLTMRNGALVGIRLIYGHITSVCALCRLLVARAGRFFFRLLAFHPLNLFLNLFLYLFLNLFAVAFFLDIL